MLKKWIVLCTLVLGTLGNSLPALWGGSALSLAGVLLGGAGALAGVWLAVRIDRVLGG